MEEQMNCKLKLNTFMPSLEHRALIKITITLWNPDDIQLDDIEWRDEKWIAEDHVIGKVKELPLPESLKKKISGFIKPIGFQILRWINHYENILSGGEMEVFSRKYLVDVEKVGKSLSKLCWTPQGTVDRKKTAKELIRDENLDIAERYKLACFYCLRDDILMLWNKMPEYCREYFYSEEDPSDVDQNELVVFWSYDIKGELIKMNDIVEYIVDNCNPYEYAFAYAVEYQNLVATEYFWQHLTSEEREKHLLEAVLKLIFLQSGRGDCVDVLFFLISQMNEEKQLEVLKCCKWDVLFLLMDWPWQDFFMEAANKCWTFLSGYDYITLLEKITDKVKDGYKDYNYKKLFREFWQQSPITQKEYVTDKWAQRDNLLLNLFEIEDKEYFKIIFASIPDREKFLFSDYGKSLCERLIFSDEMDLLEVYVRICISSKDVMMKFREEFENHIIHHCSDIKKTREEKTDKLRKLFQLLDELILEDDKRKHVDEGNTDPAAKRLCCLTNEW